MHCSNWNCSRRSHRFHTSHAYLSDHTHTGALMSERDRPRQVAMAMVDRAARTCNAVLYGFGLSSLKVIYLGFLGCLIKELFSRKGHLHALLLVHRSQGGFPKQKQTENCNQFDRNNIKGPVICRYNFISVFNYKDHQLQTLFIFTRK